MYRGSWVFYKTSLLSLSGYHLQSQAAPCRRCATFSYSQYSFKERKEERKVIREGKRKRERKGKNLNKVKTKLKKRVYESRRQT